ncbi:aspartic peptidase domain-containing protein [Parachaetomium inaequale]|uniref:Aspartic peptidase domain-containing protein n=1 Tax=Parachaetomium inaequale TaxID=2588326 RepID=A0AAN6P854_9PEZI|nr:aspartic peptidase domain-containing protein [Parachaetomium inaequale]
MILLLFYLCRPTLAQSPHAATWSAEPFGPDGPWNAVQVSLGGQAELSLFPGRVFSSFVTTSDYCAFNNSIPHCASGTYLKDAAVASARLNPNARINYRPPAQELIRGIETLGYTSFYLDAINVGFPLGAIMNHTLNIIESPTQMLAYPGGTWYPIFTGCLSLGAPDRFQVFDGMGTPGQADTPTINASMIPWALKEEGQTLSSSFSLHYGSAAPSAKVSGSLLYGGYDRSRVAGDVLSLDGDLSTLINIKDISIRVIKGSSPFANQTTPSSPNPTAITGLLAQGNSTITPAGLPVLLDPCSPYLTLPKSTCDAIASHLPVTYNPSLGLYLWNTTSPSYTPIITSASALTLTLTGTRNTESTTINIPFAHLNLTLTTPFVPSPVPYFPCFTGGTGTYVLGRAFFQDAFLGANWERKKTWLAQAPGPNISGRMDAVNIQPDQEAVEKGGNDWERSWEGFWTVLGKGEAGEPGSKTGEDGGGGSEGAGGGGGGGGGNESSPTAAGQEATAGLSTAAVAGIAVGAAVAVLGVGLLFYLRRRARKPQASPPLHQAASPYEADGKEKSLPHSGSGSWHGAPAEVSDMDNRVFEVSDVDHRVYEMPVNSPDWQTVRLGATRGGGGFT